VLAHLFQRIVRVVVVNDVLCVLAWILSDAVKKRLEITISAVKTDGWKNLNVGRYCSPIRRLF